MAVATAYSTRVETAVAFAEAYRALAARLGGDPDLLLFHYTTGHDGAALRAATAALPPAVQAHGATTCLGVITEEGVFTGDAVLGMLGLRAAGLVAGAALAPKGADPRAAAMAAMRAALDAAGRPGEMPDLVLLSATAGDEEAVLDGIAATVGPRVPVFGGTASGPRIGAPARVDLGRMFGRVAVRGAEAGDAVALTAVFAPMPMSHVFRGGCVPTGFVGVVSETLAPRVVLSIDGRPAADVYTAWVEAHTGRPAAVADADLLPLGREVGRIGEYPLYALTHVAKLRDDGALVAMTDIAAGEEVRLMAGSVESLAGRPARAMEAAVTLHCAEVGAVSGGLVAVCAGLLPRLERELARVQAEMRAAGRDRPFLGSFTFGEQGSLAEGRAVHGNLMISSLVFGG